MLYAPCDLRDGLMAGSAIISIVEPGALHGARTICEDGGNYISAKVAIYLFNHVTMGFHPQFVSQPYYGFALFIATEMDESLAVTFMPFQNSPEILEIFLGDFVHRQFYLDGLSEMLLGFKERNNPLGYNLRSLFFLL